MNSSGWIRGMMAKSMEREQFLLHVIGTIERQLKLWDGSYDVTLLEDLIGGEDYFLKVKQDNATIEVSLKKESIDDLQKQSAYALDQYIWRELEAGGLDIQVSAGNYLTYCAI